jgi:hypothetical protein
MVIDEPGLRTHGLPHPAPQYEQATAARTLRSRLSRASAVTSTPARARQATSRSECGIPRTAPLG